MSTLLEKAKEADKRTIHKITPEIVELALAWARDEISITQAKKALKVSENNKVYSILARALKEKIRSSFKEVNPHMVFSREAVEPAEPVILTGYQTPPVEVVVPDKNIKQIAHEKESSKNSPSSDDIAPGAY